MLARHAVDEVPSLNLTPMIDVVFLLIIFFMLGTKFTEIERKLELKIPEVSHQDSLVRPPEPRIINVYRDGTIAFERKPVSLPELRDQLRAVRDQFPKVSVLIRGDVDARFQRIAEVLSVCKEAQVVNVAVAVRPKPGETEVR